MLIVSAKESFLVELAVKSGLNILASKGGAAAFLFGGPVGAIIGLFTVKLISTLLFYKILPRFDIAMDKIERHLTKEDFKKFAKASYAKVTKRIYDEDEKKAIRAEYKTALKSFGTFGNGLRRS